jgi:hypothetical protein
VILAEAAFATTVTIHTDDARATLLAMQNPSLTREDAATIAMMHGNQGVLRKLHEWKIPATTETFANALIVDYPEVLCAWELNRRVITESLSECSRRSGKQLIFQFLTNNAQSAPYPSSSDSNRSGGLAAGL